MESLGLSGEDAQDKEEGWRVTISWLSADPGLPGRWPCLCGRSKICYKPSTVNRCWRTLRGDCAAGLGIDGSV